MREKRLRKFRRQRHRKLRRILLYSLVMPALIIFLGYLVAAVLILPAM